MIGTGGERVRVRELRTVNSTLYQIVDLFNYISISFFFCIIDFQNKQFTKIKLLEGIFLHLSISLALSVISPDHLPGVYGYFCLYHIVPILSNDRFALLADLE